MSDSTRSKISAHESSAFISYAQNFEDVMLWRALKDIPQGFYVDAGANDPHLHSVTKSFYDIGWHGINIEPVTQWFDRLQRHRPRDVNLPVALGSMNAFKTLYEVRNTGLSTFEKHTAERHKRDLGIDFVERKVRVRRLADVCHEHCRGPIHFLKIDVEGAEQEVLQGMDLRAFRPWIIVVEAVLPNLTTQNYDLWESLIVRERYDFVYFDGLNRFYLSQEHEDLREHFRLPPNAFDYFELASAREAQMRAEVAEFKVRELEGRLAAMLDSTSWRITHPLRAVRQLLLDRVR